MCFSKGTGWMEMNEYHKARKVIKREQYEERIRKQIQMENEKKQKKILKMRNRLCVLENKQKLTAKEIERKNEILDRLKGND